VRIAALAQAMQTYPDAPADTLLRMGEAVHRRVLARHSVDTAAAKLTKLFQAASKGRT
jgi:hypothetical protein